MTTLAQLQYGYDRSGNRLYRRDAVGHSAGFDELYGYDGLNRLTSFHRGELNNGNNALVGDPTLGQGWTLDPTGNWSGFNQTDVNPLTQTRTHNPVNEITAISKTVGADWATPAYDANGNMTTLPKPTSLGDGMTGTYDAWNRLVKLTDSGGTVAEYRYDGLNRRTEKIVGGATRHSYYSDQWQTLEERIDAGTSAERQFVWGQRYVDDLVLRDRSAGGSLNERLYSLQDALFNVVALTSNTGAVQERFAYQPYGQSQELNPDFTNYSGADYQWESRFTGRQLDLESRLQINRHRYLHLQLGRWMTRDPADYYNDEWNLYGYVLCDPLTLADPLGEALDSITASIERCLKLPYPANLKCVEDLIFLYGKQKRFDILKCEMVHAAYDKLNCTGCDKCQTQADALTKIACLTAELAGRNTYLRMRCDYILPGSIGRPGGSKKAEAGHKQQLIQVSTMLAKCTALLPRLPK